MGWTEYSATYYHRSGEVDRKRECDAYFMEGLNKDHFLVRKSRMVGSVYYAAVTPLLRVKTDNCGNHLKDADDHYVYERIPVGEQETIGVVLLTATRERGEYFAYKPMDETVGPMYYHCPKSILNLLTPTENKWALEWRDKCYENASKPKLGKLPIGTKIEFELNGHKYRLAKMAPAYQFKTPWWMVANAAEAKYFPRKKIPDNFIVLDPVAQNA